MIANTCKITDGNPMRITNLATIVDDRILPQLEMVNATVYPMPEPLTRQLTRVLEHQKFQGWPEAHHDRTSSTGACKSWRPGIIASPHS